MNQAELNEILDEAYAEILKNEYSEEEILKKISKFLNDDGKISYDKVSVFFFLENTKFTKLYLDKVLSRTLCK